MFNTKSEDTYFKSYFSLTFNGPIFCWKIPMIPKRQRNNDTPLSIEATRENTPWNLRLGHIQWLRGQEEVVGGQELPNFVHVQD